MKKTEENKIEPETNNLSTGKRLFGLVWGTVHKNNLTPIIVIILGFYFYILPAFVNRHNTNEPLRKESSNILPAKRDVSNQRYRLTVKKADDKEETYYIDSSGNVFEKERYDSVLKSTFSRFDFRLRPGIGCVVLPEKKDLESILEPAFILGVFEMYDRVSLDGIINQNRAGGGLSVKIKTKYTTNSYLGCGLAVDYETTEKEFIVYGKINF